MPTGDARPEGVNPAVGENAVPLGRNALPVEFPLLLSQMYPSASMATALGALRHRPENGEPETLAPALVSSVNVELPAFAIQTLPPVAIAIPLGALSDPAVNPVVPESGAPTWLSSVTLLPPLLVTQTLLLASTAIADGVLRPSPLNVTPTVKSLIVESVG